MSGDHDPDCADGTCDGGEACGAVHEDVPTGKQVDRLKDGVWLVDGQLNIDSAVEFAVILGLQQRIGLFRDLIDLCHRAGQKFEDPQDVADAIAAALLRQAEADMASFKQLVGLDIEGLVKLKAEQAARPDPEPAS